MMESERLPRLTRSIRAFSDLARPSSKTLATSVDHANKLRAKQMKDGLSWSDLRKYVEQDAGSKSPAVKELGQLRSLAQELSGDQSKDVVDEAAAFLLSLFIDERLLTKKSSLILKQMFGAVSFNMATKVCELANALVVLSLTAKDGRDRDLLRDLPEPRVPYYDTSLLHDLSAPVGVQAVREFSMDYDSLAATLPPKEEPHGRSWLEKEVKKYYEVKNPSGLSIEEFLETVVTMLRSGRTNDELQNELFDLLGFDRFELIQMLLQHRTDIVYSAAIAEEKKLIISKAAPDLRRPNYGCQVVVQSEQEKQLIKQARKEEKKISKVM
ncbi:unnamed protein product, partial [Timema podura]|nr:unnamed protein product [Timema podura]